MSATSCETTSGDNNVKPKLRLLTYLYPGLPMGLFQTYQHYLEEILGYDSYLIVENRYSAPPTGKVDPFTANDADIVFMCSTGYIRLLDERNAYMELLPVAPVFDDPRTDGRPVYFSDVIIRSEKADSSRVKLFFRYHTKTTKAYLPIKCIYGKTVCACRPNYKEFSDLRGHRWAVNDTESLSGNTVLFSQLKSLGVNASFFGHIVHSGSHHESINMVLNNVVDAAAIDSNALRFWCNEHPTQKSELHVLCSWGPNPVQPIAINSRLPAEIKDKITNALHSFAEHPVYREKFNKYGITGFQPVDSSSFERVREITSQAKDEQLYPAYY